MSDVATLEAALAELRRRDGKYNERAYVFVLAALEFAQTRLPARRQGAILPAARPAANSGAGDRRRACPARCG